MMSLVIQFSPVFNVTAEVLFAEVVTAEVVETGSFNLVIVGAAVAF